MRKRSGQVHSRESSATLQLTVSLLYPFTEMSLRYVSLCSIIIDILDGASYLFDKKPPFRGSVLEREEHLKQLLESIGNPVKDGTPIQDGSIMGQKKCDGGDETQ